MIYVGVLISLIYLLILIWLVTGIISDKQIIDDSFHPKVSIIISAHNEEKNLSHLINALINQDYDSDYEIIIANDRSTDFTKKIIDNYVKDYLYIKIINIDDTPIGWGHKKWGLQQCIEKSKYDIILQTDADCIPKSRWIKSMIINFSNPNVVFVSAPSPMQNKDNLFSTYYKLDSLAQDALSASAISQNLAFSCTGRNMGFLKQSFLAINGYEGIEHYQSGDDDLLFQKFATLLNGIIKFSFNADSIVESPPPKSLKGFLNQRIRYASKGIDYYKLNTTIEFKLLLPFLYIVNLICLIGIISFVRINDISYLLPFIFKIIADYWMCSNFYNKINEKFMFAEFLILSVIHPIYVVSLGLISPFITYTWKSNG